jgi:hypothetical protein
MTIPSCEVHVRLIRASQDLAHPVDQPVDFRLPPAHTHDLTGGCDACVPTLVTWTALSHW